MSELDPTRQEIKQALLDALDEREITTKADVARMLADLGLRVKDPAGQRRDLERLHEWAECVDQVKSKGLLTTVAIVATGIVAIVVLGLKTWLRQ